MKVWNCVSRKNSRKLVHPGIVIAEHGIVPWYCSIRLRTGGSHAGDPVGVLTSTSSPAQLRWEAEPSNSQGLTFLKTQISNEREVFCGKLLGAFVSQEDAALCSSLLSLGSGSFGVWPRSKWAGRLSTNFPCFQLWPKIPITPFWYSRSYRLFSCQGANLNILCELLGHVCKYCRETTRQKIPRLWMAQLCQRKATQLLHPNILWLTLILL